MNKENKKQALENYSGSWRLFWLVNYLNIQIILEVRNPYAHVAICVKEKFNDSYKDIPDEKFNEVIKFIEFLKKNPS